MIVRRGSEGYMMRWTMGRSDLGVMGIAWRSGCDLSDRASIMVGVMAGV